MNKNEIDNLIKVSDKLDDAVFKGIQRGKTYKRLNGKSNKKTRLRKVAVAAAVTISVTGILAAANPEVISAIPGIGNIFDILLGNNKYKNNAKNINKTIESNGVKITLDQLSMDKGRIAATFIVKAEDEEKLEKYRVTNHGGIMLAKATLNGEYDNIIQNRNSSAGREGDSDPYIAANNKSIDKNTVVAVYEMDIDGVDINKEMDLSIDIMDDFYSWTTEDPNAGKGEFKFDLKLNKDDVMVDTKDIKETELGKIDNIEYKLNEGLISELGNRFKMTVSGDSIEDDLRISYVAKDDQGRYVRIGGDAGKAVNGTREQYLETKANLKDIKYIDLYPIVEKFEMREPNRDINDTSNLSVFQCINGSNNIKEKCTEAFKERETVTYSPILCNADKEKSFFTLDELVGKSIEGGNNTKATVKSVTTDGEYTTFVLSEETGYFNFGIMPEIIDEDYKFYMLGENCEISDNFDEYGEKEMTLKVKGIDKNKKYTLGATKEEDVKMDEAKKIRIDLNK